MSGEAHPLNTLIDAARGFLSAAAGEGLSRDATSAFQDGHLYLAAIRDDPKRLAYRTAFFAAFVAMAEGRPAVSISECADLATMEGSVKGTMAYAALLSTSADILDGRTGRAVLEDSLEPGPMVPDPNVRELFDRLDREREAKGLKHGG